MRGTQQAQGSVEYGLLIASICLLVLIGAIMWGQVLQGWFATLVAHIVAQGVIARVYGI